MEEIAICFITHNNFFETKYFVQNLLYKTKHKYRLHILDNCSDDERVVKYLEQVAEDTKGYFYHADDHLSHSECLNRLLGSVYQEYCTILPLGAMINENWLIDLKTQYSTLNNSGVLSIRNGSELLALSPQLHNTLENGESELKNVYVTQYFTVEGVLFFRKNITLTIGPFETDNLEGFEEKEFTLRAYLNGYINHYISRQVYYQLPITDEVLKPKISVENEKNYKKHIDNFIKTKHKKQNVTL